LASCGENQGTERYARKAFEKGHPAILVTRKRKKSANWERGTYNVQRSTFGVRGQSGTLRLLWSCTL
jgi:hypothetical protein